MIKKAWSFLFLQLSKKDAKKKKIQKMSFKYLNINKHGQENETSEIIFYLNYFPIYTLEMVFGSLL